MSTVCPRTPGPCPRVLILTHGLPALAMTLRFTTSSNGGLFSRNDTPNPGLAPVEQFGIFQVFRQRGSFLTKLCPHQGQGCHGFTLTCAPLARASAKICLAFQRSLPGQPKDARAFPALPPRLPKFCRAVPTLRHLSPKVATTMPAPANPRSPGPRPRLPSLPMAARAAGTLPALCPGSPGRAGAWPPPALPDPGRTALEPPAGVGGGDRIGATWAESQWIVAARPLCHLQYPVAYLSRLQRILPAARWEFLQGVPCDSSAARVSPTTRAFGGRGPYCWSANGRRAHASLLARILT